MIIGEASHRSGVSAKMIRHYEQIGLIGAAERTAAGYRIYSEHDVHRLRFIKRARNLGFPVSRIAKLLSLWDDKKRSSSKVKALALDHIASLQAQIDDMQAILKTLQSLAASCHGDDREACPILDDLAGTAPPCRPQRS